MLKSFRLFFLILVMVGSLVFGPVTPAHALTFPAEINKSFTPIAITSGGISKLRVTVYNANSNPLTSAAWADDLIGVQPGLSVANPIGLTNTCGGSVTAISGGTSIALSGGTVPRQVGSTIGSCYVEVNVTSTTPGNLINTIPAGALTSTVLDGLIPVAISNTTPASATLNVIAVQAPSLSKGFSPNTIFVGQTSTLTITIRNNDLNSSLTNTTFTDALPTSVVIATIPNIILTGCGAGTLTGVGASPLTAGDTSITLNNGTIIKNSNCVIKVDVTSVQQGTYTNTIPSGSPSGGSIPIQTQQGVSNASPASAPLNVQAFNLSKSFSTSPVAVGQASTLTITVQNPANFTYTGVKIPDVLPAGLEYFVGTPTMTGCGAATLEGPTSGTPLASGDTTLNLVGGTILPNSTCTINLDVVPRMDAPATTYTNTIPTGALVTDQGNSNHIPASANLAVQSLSIGKAFSPSTFAVGSTSTLTITISNPSPNPFTGATLADTLPITPNSNLRFTGIPTTTCTTGTDGAAVTLPGGAPTRTVSLTSGTIPGGSIAIPGTCTIIATVTTDAAAPAAGPYTNTIPAGDLTTTEGGTNALPATANVSVVTLSVNKVFSPSLIAAGGTSTLTITITNPATALPISGINLTDTLPAGLQISGTPTAIQCNGGAVTSTATSITLTAGSLPIGPSSCTIVANVTASVSVSSGTFTNTINPGDVTTTEGPTNSNTVNSDLTVAAVSIVKSFSPISFQAGDQSTLTITLQNYTGSPYTVSTVSPFVDTLPATPNTNLTVVTGTEATTCVGGTVSTTLPRTISLSGGIIPAGTLAVPGTCTITVQVTAPSGAPDATYTNTIFPSDLTTVEGAKNTNTFTANVSVYTLGQGVSATKTFNPTSILVGQNSRLRITINAPADTDLSNFSVTDNLPGDLTISNSTAPTKTGCGVSSVLSSPVAGTTISLTSGTIVRGTPCVITVFVTSNTGSTPGVVNTNTINPGNITDTEVRSVPAPVTAPLTVRTTSTLTTSKSFYPDAVSPNGLSTLTITLTNTGAVSLDNVVLTDTLPGSSPNEIVIAPTPNASTTCAPGTLTAVAGSKTISLSNGSIPAQVGAVPGICTINVDVQGTGSVQTYTNSIPTSNVTGTIHNTASTMNPQASASAQIKVQNLSIEIVKGFNPQLVHGGTASTLSIQLRNPNTSAVLTGINFTDTMPVGMYIADIPNFVPSAIGDCGPGATLTGTPETNVFTFSGGMLAPNATCTMTLSTTIVVNGNLTNTIPIAAVTTFNGVHNQSATSASLTNLAGASITKGFAPNPINAGLANYSILTITIRNTETIALTGMGLVDSLPAGLQVAGGSAPAPTNNCGGALTANPGNTSVQLSGGSLPRVVSAGDIIKCTITVPVTGATPGVYTNTIPGDTLVTVEGATNVDDTTATLTLNPFSLGNRIWYDTNNNGVVDGGELGISGVRVELYRDNGTTPGIFDAGDTFVDFQTTDSTGYYRFDGLGADDYVVLIPPSQFDTGGPLAGYLSSGTSMASNGTVTDSFGPDADTTVTDDDDNGVSSFVSNILNYVSSQAVTIGPGGTEPINETNPTPNPDSGEAVDNQSDRTVDFGFYRQQLSNQIFTDLNTDGNFSGADAGLAGAIVQLYASDGTTEILVGPDGILNTADDATGGITTVAAGTYLFSGLPAGDYIVKVTPPADYSTTDSADTATPNSNIDNNDNGIGTGTGQVPSNIVTLTPGVVGVSTTVTASTGTTLNPSLDFGFIPRYSLGNRVWFDTNNNSTMNGSEVGISGVRVNLYLDNGATPGVFDGTDTFINFKTTDASGYYRFDGLDAGDYVVVIPSSEFSTGAPLDQYWSSGTTIASDGTISDSTAADPDNNTDRDDNGITTFTLNNISYVSAKAVTLGPGVAEPTTDNDPVLNPASGEAPNNQSNRTVDFGFYRVALSNQIFWDVNANGLFNLGDSVLANVVVKLYASNGTTEIPVGPDGILGTTDDAAGGVTTGIDGKYLFGGLPAGNYIVKVTPAAGFESTIDTADSTDSATPNTNTDNNDNGIGTTSGEVSSNAVALTPGVVNINNIVTNSTGTTENPTLDFGFSEKYSIGNRVWFDTNNGSSISPSEVGVDGVTVNLYAASNLSVILATDTTSNGGYYLFDNLFPGDYVVSVAASNFSGVLNGYLSSGTSRTTAGVISETAAAAANSDTDSDDNGTLQTSGLLNGAVISSTITLGPGNSEPTSETDLETGIVQGNQPDGRANMTVDFGFYTMSLGNLIWSDSDKNGAFNGGETGTNGVSVQLWSGDGTLQLGTTTTAAGGLYSFTGLAQGNYIVKVIAPAGTSSSVDNFNQTDNDTPTTNADNNDNGIGILSGTVSSNYVTLTPGLAQVSNTVDNATGSTVNPTLDFGFTPVFSIGNRVWFDTDNSGTINGSEVGVNGVTVKLFASDGVTEIHVGPDGILGNADDLTGDVTTANGGYYLFSNLQANNYIVVLPSSNFSGAGVLTGYWSSSTSRNNAGVVSETTAALANNDVDSDDNGTLASGAVTSSIVTLGPTTTSEPAFPSVESDIGPGGQGEPDQQANMTVDFGFYTITLGDTVWNDSDNNGALNGAEVGLGSVTVQLRSADDSTVLATTTTNGSGTYTFSGLPAGSYIVRLPASDFNPGGILRDYISSTGALNAYEPAPNAETNTTDSDDNGTAVGSALGPDGTYNSSLGLGGYIQSSVFALTPNAENAATSNNALGLTSEPRVDIGVYTLAETDLTITKDDGVSFYIPGGTLNYTIVVSNKGPSDVVGAVVNDAKPTQIASWTWTCDPGNPVTSNCNGGSSAPFSDTINLLQGESVTYHVVATIVAAPSGKLINTVTVTNPVNELVPGDNTDTDTDELASLHVTKDDGQTIISAGNTITYQIVVTNNGTIDLTSINVSDTLPSDLTFVSLGSTPAPTTQVGNALTWSGISLTVGSSTTFTVNAIVNASPSSTITNTATAVDTNTNTSASGSDVDSTASAPQSNVTKTLISTDATHTTDPHVTIGEILTYEVVLSMPAGSMTNAILVDTPQSGLAFVDLTSLVVSNPDTDGAGLDTGISSSVMTFAAGGACTNCVAGIISGTSNPLIENNGGKITFDFDTLTNNSASTETITIRYTVIVLDIASNQHSLGTTLKNDVTWTWDGGNSVRPASVPVVDVVEPVMTINKNATPNTADVGTPVTFTIDLSHSALSSADAFDVVVTDVLPPGLAFIPGTFTFTRTSGTLLQPPTFNYNAATTTLTFVWDEFPLTESARLQFQATFVGPSPVQNTATAQWTSLKIDPSTLQLSTYNVNSTERSYDPLNQAGVNNYIASSSVTITNPRREPLKDPTHAARLPKTGFAPDEITTLPEQPDYLSYLALSDLWLEIPKLGVKEDIVGVPYENNDWNLTWLGRQAGYLDGTAYPTHDGNSVLTAHAYLADGTAGPFVKLNTLSYGDQIIVHLGGQKYVYEVRENLRVSPNNTSVIKHEEKPWLTLITCLTYNEQTKDYTYRIAIRAVLVKIE